MGSSAWAVATSLHSLCAWTTSHAAWWMCRAVTSTPRVCRWRETCSRGGVPHGVALAGPLTRFVAPHFFQWICGCVRACVVVHDMCRVMPGVVRWDCRIPRPMRRRDVCMS